MKVTVSNSGTISATLSPTSPRVNVPSVGIQGPAGPQGPQGIPGAQGPAGIQNISQASDVDISNRTDGSILIFSQDTEKWSASTQLTAQNMDGGHF